MVQGWTKVVAWPVWAPVAAGMRRLRFPAKMALICGAFLLPLALLLGQQLAAGRQRIAETAQARSGLRQAQATLAALQQAGGWRQAARSAAFGGADAAAADPAAARQRYALAHDALGALQAELGPQLGTAAAWQATQAAYEAARAVAVAARPAPQALYDSQVALARALVALLDRTVDGARLSLDPEPASLHLASALLEHAPEWLEASSELGAWSAARCRPGR